MNVEKFHERLKELYLPAQDRFTLVDVPEIRYAMIDGRGDPAGEESVEAAKWLFSVAHLVKPMIKERMGKNFVEPPIEYLCWAADERDFIAGKRDKWNWTAMIVFIDWITKAHFEEAVANVAKKRGTAPASLRLDALREGKSVQIMHVGDYSGVSKLCEELYSEYLPANGYRPNGKYHEIYLNDPARTAPEKRKIVIRQPVR